MDFRRVKCGRDKATEISARDIIVTPLWLKLSEQHSRRRKMGFRRPTRQLPFRDSLCHISQVQQKKNSISIDFQGIKLFALMLFIFSNTNRVLVDSHLSPREPSSLALANTMRSLATSRNELFKYASASFASAITGASENEGFPSTRTLSHARSSPQEALQKKKVFSTHLDT